MKRKSNIINLVNLVSLISSFALFACQAPPAAQAEPSPNPVVSEMAQWAFGALADSTVVGLPVGEPNTTTCSSSTSGWKAVESLDIYFKQPVVPSEANIFTKAELPPGTTVKLIGFNENVDDAEYELNMTDAECPLAYNVQIDEYDDPVIGLRITSKTKLFKNWEVVDGVEMIGLPFGPPLDISTTKLATPAPTATPTPVPVGERELRDRTDDFAGKYQLHTVYVLFKNDKDMERDTDGSIANSINLANDWFKDQTGGAALRFDTYHGELDVTFVQFDITAKEALEKYRAQYDLDRKKYNLVIEDYYLDYVTSELSDRDFFQKGKYYIFYLERKHPNLCGYSLISGVAGIFFLGTQNCGYGRLGVDAHAWNTEFVMLHEILHGIGFSPPCAPHNISDNPYHVGDSRIDLMYPYAGADQQYVLDIGNDDYYRHGVKDCPDLANSAFLEPLPDHPESPADWPRYFLLDK